MKRIAVIPRSKLTARERALFRTFGDHTAELRADDHARLRNALRALVAADPRWLTWVERNLPGRLSKFTRAELQILETRVRAIVLKRYAKIFSEGQITTMLFDYSLPFNASGAMVQI